MCKIVMCENCKEVFEQPINRCSFCNSSSFCETHPENIVGKRQLGREYYLDSKMEETGVLIWQHKGVCWMEAESKYYAKNEMGLIPILSKQLTLKCNPNAKA